MTKLYNLLFVVVALSVAASVSAQTVAVKAEAPVAERPVLNVGDRWGYDFNGGNPYDLTVLSVDADGKSTSVWKNRSLFGSSGKSIRDKNLNQVGSTGIAYPAFDFPLFVGKKDQVNYDVKKDGITWHNVLTREVVGFEKRTVPAGRFDTFRMVVVRKYSNESNSDGGTETDTYWYAPAVRNFVERQTTNTETNQPVVRKLLNYTLAE